MISKLKELGFETLRETQEKAVKSGLFDKMILLIRTITTVTIMFTSFHRASLTPPGGGVCFQLVVYNNTRKFSSFKCKFLLPLKTQVGLT